MDCSVYLYTSVKEIFTFEEIDIVCFTTRGQSGIKSYPVACQNKVSGGRHAEKEIYFFICISAYVRQYIHFCVVHLTGRFKRGFLIFFSIIFTN